VIALCNIISILNTFVCVVRFFKHNAN